MVFTVLPFIIPFVQKVRCYLLVVQYNIVFKVSGTGVPEFLPEDLLWSFIILLLADTTSSDTSVYGLISSLCPGQIRFL